jgi:hypothetical protein
MAKPVNPAEAPIGARPPRPVQRVRLDAALGEQRVDEHAGVAGAGQASLESEPPAPHERIDDAVGARSLSDEPRPGLAWARRADISGSPASAVASEPASALALGSRVPKLPMASLEGPSTSRLDLTPSPVPRVALAPATGAVDISLVPGPHSVGSRNLPTLAAQHLLGVRARRRPAPAVTVPPAVAGREVRSAFMLARDVRSSKSEIVLGLTIGLGVSMLLAGLGQAYLRDDAIADAPARLESVTLSARPEMPAGSAAPARGAAPTDAVAASPAASSDRASSAAPATGAAADARAAAIEPRASGVAAIDAAGARDEARDAAGASMWLARAGASNRAERTQPRATPARSTRARHSHPAASAPAADDSPAAPPPDAVPPAAILPAAPLTPPSDPAPAPAPLTPAESAGLGLDLPL